MFVDIRTLRTCSSHSVSSRRSVRRSASSWYDWCMARTEKQVPHYNYSYNYYTVDYYYYYYSPSSAYRAD